MNLLALHAALQARLSGLGFGRNHQGDFPFSCPCQKNNVQYPCFESILLALELQHHLVSMSA